MNFNDIFWNNVDNGPKKSSLNFDDVPDSVGTLSFDLPNTTIKKQPMKCNLGLLLPLQNYYTGDVGTYVGKCTNVLIYSPGTSWWRSLPPS